MLPVNAAPLAGGVEREPHARRAIPNHDDVRASLGKLAAAVPRAQDGGLRRQRQTETALRVDYMRELTLDAIGDEGMHLACGVEPAMRELGMARTRMPHELAEMRFDASGLREADEMRDYGHAGAPSMRPRERGGSKVVGRVGLEPTTNGLRGWRGIEENEVVSFAVPQKCTQLWVR